MFNLKSLFCLVLLLFLLHNAAAQKWEFGLAGGLAWSRMSADSLYTGIMLGGNAGISVQYNLKDKSSLRTEPAYLSRNSRYKNWPAHYGDVWFEYIVVPVLYQYEVYPGIRLAAGPELNIPVGISENHRGRYHNYFYETETSRAVFLSLAAGVDVELRKRIIFHTRYEKSLHGHSFQTAVIGLRFIIDKDLFGFAKRKPKGVSTPRYHHEYDPEEENIKQDEENRWKIRIHGFEKDD